MSQDKTPNPEDDIVTVEAREHVRLRPGMYFGGTDQRALHQLVYEVLDDSLEQAIAGQCDRIWLTLHKNHTVSVRNNDKGISVEMTKQGRRFLEILMTRVWSGRSIQVAYRISGGLHGIGLSAVNALAAECIVEVARDGYLWRQEYRQGIAHTEVVQIRTLESDEATGTTITFRPDFTILEPKEFDYDALAARSRELTYLIPDVTITISDERGESVREDKFYFPDGLVTYVAHLNKAHPVIHEPLSHHEEWSVQPTERNSYKMMVDVALQYADTMETTIIGYVNTIRTSGGFHTAVVPSVLLETLNQRLKDEVVDQPFSLNEILPGLTVVVSLNHSSPQFRSQVDIHLMNPEVSGIVAKAVYGAVSRYWYEDRGAYNNIVQKCLANRRTLKDERV